MTQKNLKLYEVTFYDKSRTYTLAETFSEVDDKLGEIESILVVQQTIH